MCLNENIYCVRQTLKPEPPNSLLLAHISQHPGRLLNLNNSAGEKARGDGTGRHGNCTRRRKAGG